MRAPTFGLITFSVVVQGPSTRTTGEEGTWTANVTDGTAPFSYQWGGDVTGTDAFVTETFWDEAPHELTVTVTDANNLQAYDDKTVYVCLDVC
jgi:hypothetical protein